MDGLKKMQGQVPELSRGIWCLEGLFGLVKNTQSKGDRDSRQGSLPRERSPGQYWLVYNKCLSISSADCQNSCCQLGTHPLDTFVLLIIICHCERVDVGRLFFMCVCVCVVACSFHLCYVGIQLGLPLIHSSKHTHVAPS